jgi:hypothetical protein
MVVAMVYDFTSTYQPCDDDRWIEDIIYTFEIQYTERYKSLLQQSKMFFDSVSDLY